MSIGRKRFALVALGLAIAGLGALALRRPAQRLSNESVPTQVPTDASPVADYPSASECATCHPQIYAEWLGSSHARSAASPLIHASVCGRCHAPVGVMLDPEYMFVVADPDAPHQYPPSAAEGVTCIVCHTEAHAPTEQVLTFSPEWPNWETTDLALSLSAFSEALGPFGSGEAGDPPPVANGFHDSRISSELADAEFCRPCHEVLLDKTLLDEQLGSPRPNLRLLTTFDEWAASTNSADGKTCQGCHMPTLPESIPVAIPQQGMADEPPPRRRTSHAFAGVDTEYTTVGPRVEQQETSATAWLSGVAAVELSAPVSIAAGKTLDLSVSVENLGVGHNLPSGKSFWREVWLEIEVRDASGGAIYSSGHVDADGWLYDEFSPAVRADPTRYDGDLLSLRSRMVRITSDLDQLMADDRSATIPADSIVRNRNGTPIVGTNVLDVGPIVAVLDGAHFPEGDQGVAVEEVYVMRFGDTIIDEGLPAHGSRIAHYQLVAPPDANGPLRVSARLLMRALPPHMMAQQEELPDPLPRLPIFVIDDAHAMVAIVK